MSSNSIPLNKKKGVNTENFAILVEENLSKEIEKDIKNLVSLKKNKNLIGKLAIITGIISFFPIMYRIWLTKNTTNFTYKNLGLALFSNALWMYYGVLGNTSANLWSGILYFGIYGYILFFKVFF